MQRMPSLFRERDGPITQGAWWLGTIALVAALTLASLAGQRHLPDIAWQRGLDIFLGVMALLPAHHLNRRRFAARGIGDRPADLYAALTLIVILAALFLPDWRISAALGLLLILATLWLVIELGLMPDKAPIIDGTRLQAYAPEHERSDHPETRTGGARRVA
jgi:uncharacterized membrane protein YhaH (DUF805 family)